LLLFILSLYPFKYPSLLLFSPSPFLFLFLSHQRTYSSLFSIPNILFLPFPHFFSAFPHSPFSLPTFFQSLKPFFSLQSSAFFFEILPLSGILASISQRIYPSRFAINKLNSIGFSKQLCLTSSPSKNSPFLFPPFKDFYMHANMLDGIKDNGTEFSLDMNLFIETIVAVVFSGKEESAIVRTASIQCEVMGGVAYIHFPLFLVYCLTLSVPCYLKF